MSAMKTKLLICQSGAVSRGARGSAHKAPARAGFTLIELLIVIAVIGTLAALLIPVFAGVTKHSLIYRAQSERDQIETALERYHTYYGFYPPGNASASANNLAPALTNQLYYELEGTTTNGSAAIAFTTLDSASTVAGTVLPSTFGPGVAGFMNYTKGSGEDLKNAENFFPGIKASQIASNGVVSVLVTSVSSDANYIPMPGFTTLAGRVANPWRYLYPGVRNPSSYDLWIQIEVGGKTNLICNWNSQAQINPALP